ncbi:MAG: hypothetical protein C4348_00820 [Patescibacteria group bacterium]
MEEFLFYPRGSKLKSPLPFLFSFYIFFVFPILFTFFYFVNLQVFHKKEAEEIKKNINYLTIFNYSQRGDIYDSFNNLLITSEKSYDVYLNLDDFENKELIEKLVSKSNLYFYWGNEVIIRNLSLKDISDLVLKKEKYPHLFIIPSYKRKYLVKEEMGNLIGNLGLGDEKKFLRGEFVGQTGIEYFYNDYLRGRPGKIVYLKEKNNYKEIFKENDLRGNDLYLTIDWELQKRLYEAMDKYFKENGYKKGALVMLDPNSGKILTLISYPSYDPDVFVNKRTKIKEVLTDPYQPLFNRVISGLYSPGSTIKLIMAAAALEEKIVTPETKIFAAGSIKIPHPYFPGIYSVFKDNKFHGWTDIYKAIYDSVNIYFYVIGGGYPYPSDEIPIKDGLGIERIIKYWKKFNLGEKSGIDLPGEKSGFLPSPETKKNTLDPIWRLGDTYNVSIGQGDLLVTPLQIALWTSAFVNNKIYKPYIVEKIVSPENKIIFENRPQVLKENIMSSSTLNVIKEAMRLTTIKGTAKILAEAPLEIAGKSGSPQIFGKEKLNAIFTGFFPYKKPEVVMTLLIEEVPYGSVATLPLYKEIVNIYYNLKLERENGRNPF